MTTTLRLDEELLPSSLLPTLHDCLHHRPPLYYAELEQIYQSVTNWAELGPVWEKQKALQKQLGEEVKDAGWFSTRWKKRRFLKTCRRLLVLGLAWGFLFDLRAEYLEQLGETAEAKVKEALSTLPHLHLSEQQLDQLSLVNVRLPTSQATPPYVHDLPPSAINCILLCLIHLDEKGNPFLAGMRDLRKRVGEAKGKEEEWWCGQQAINLIDCR